LLESHISYIGQTWLDFFNISVHVMLIRN